MPKKNLLDNLLSEELNDLDEDEKLKPLLEEIHWIINDALNSFVRKVLLNVPEHFWTAPAETIPDVNPPDEYLEGGLVKHTRRVAYLCSMFADAQGRSQNEKDILIAAALLHDILKMDCESVDPLHAYKIDMFVEPLILDEENATSNTKASALYIATDPETLLGVLRLVRVHNGLMSPIPETIPVTSIEWIFAFANLIAKKIHVVNDLSWMMPTQD